MFKVFERKKQLTEAPDQPEVKISPDVSQGDNTAIISVLQQLVAGNNYSQLEISVKREGVELPIRIIHDFDTDSFRYFDSNSLIEIREEDVLRFNFANSSVNFGHLRPRITDEQLDEAQETMEALRVTEPKIFAAAILNLGLILVILLELLNLNPLKRVIWKALTTNQHLVL